MKPDKGDEKMKKFEAPEFKIRIFENQDIITTSPTDDEIDPGPDGENELPILPIG